MQDAGADIGIMAFVLQFVRQEFVKIRKHSTIQYSRFYLPKYRGPVPQLALFIKGEAETGLTRYSVPRTTGWTKAPWF